MRALALTALVAVTAAVVGCGEEDRPASAPVRVGYASGFDANDAAERVIYKRMERAGGPKVEMQELNGPQNAVTALLREDIDVASMPHLTATAAVAEGANIKLVLVGLRVPQWRLIARPGTGSPRELQGKKIAVFGLKTNTSALAEVVLAKAGLSEDDAELVAAGDSAERLVALERGKVEAAVLEYADILNAGEKLSGYVNLGTYGKLPPITAENVFAVSGKRLREEPEEVERFVHGMLDGYAVIYGPDGREAFVAEGSKGPFLNGSRARAGKLYDYHRSIGIWPRGDRPYTAAEYARAVRFWKRHGVVEKSAPFSEIWDTSFWR